MMGSEYFTCSDAKYYQVTRTFGHASDISTRRHVTRRYLCVPRRRSCLSYARDYDAINRMRRRCQIRARTSVQKARRFQTRKGYLCIPRSNDEHGRYFERSRADEFWCTGFHRANNELKRNESLRINSRAHGRVWCLDGHSGRTH